MQVFINGTPLLAPLTGIGQYVRHLGTALNSQNLCDLSMFCGGRFQEKFDIPSSSSSQNAQKAQELFVRWLPFPRYARRAVQSVLFGYHGHRLAKQGVIYHEPNYLPLPYDGPLVLTVCDMSCFDHPETHPDERIRLMHTHFPKALERADRVIVISNDSGQALQRWFSIDSTKITTTHLAADPRFQPLTSEMLQPSLAKMGLTEKKYILCVGTLEPRKNLSTLFAAYTGLPAQLRERYPLVVAGMKGWQTEQLMMDAQTLVTRGELRMLGYVPDEEMPALYAGAAVFCYPSRYEGFGLPALEAMAAGVPVVTGNLTSLPEVVGDAGLMTHPDDYLGMRAALRALLEEPQLATEKSQAGLIRAATFSWERCAQETAAVYSSIRSK